MCKVASATVNGLNGFWIGTLMPSGLNAKCRAGILEWIGRKRSSRQGSIKKRARIFEVGKQYEVFVANVARK